MIEAINTSSEKDQLQAEKLAAAFATGVGGAKNDQSAQRVVKEVVTLLNSDSNVRLTTARQKADAPGSQVSVTGAPTLDEPDSKTNREQDLEKLLMYLQLDTDESLTKMAQTRLQSQQGLLEVKHKQMHDQILKNQAELNKALETQKRMKMLSWILFGISALVTVLTCGAAVGATMAAKVAADVAVKAAASVMVKRAIQAAVGFALQTIFTVLGETGVTEKGIKAMAKSIKSHGLLNEAESEAVASAIFMVLQIAAVIGGTYAAGSIAGAANGAKSVSNTVVRDGLNKMRGVNLGSWPKEALKFINRAFASDLVSIGAIGFTAISMGATSAGQIVSAFVTRDANRSEADTRLIEAAMARIQQMMDETVEEMQLLLTQVEDHLSRMANVVNSAYETEVGIAQRMGQMA